MQKVLIITTGGTISMVAGPDGGDIPALNGDLIINQIPKHYLPAEIDVYEYANKPSPHITMDDMVNLVRIIRENKDRYHGFVITHGTDVLEETAFFLDVVLENNIKVALTASMRANDDIGVDGPRNLLSAIKTVLSPQSDGYGVLVVINDEIHDPYTVTKTYTSNVATFQSPGFGLLGIVDEDKVFFARSKKRNFVFKTDKYEKEVILYKTYVGDDGALLRTICHSVPFKGIVIEGFGRGNVPPMVANVIYEIVEKNIPVVVSTRCHLGRTLGIYAYEGGGKSLENHGVILSKDIKPHKALILLKLLLGLGSNIDEIRSVFDIF